MSADMIRLVHKRGHRPVKLEDADDVVCDRCGLTARVDNGKASGELLTRDCGRPTGVSYCYGARR